MEPRQHTDPSSWMGQMVTPYNRTVQEWFAFIFTPMLSGLFISVVKPFVCDVIISLTTCVH